MLEILYANLSKEVDAELLSDILNLTNVKKY